MIAKILDYQKILKQKINLFYYQIIEREREIIHMHNQYDPMNLDSLNHLFFS